MYFLKSKRIKMRITEGIKSSFLNTIKRKKKHVKTKYET